MKIDGTLSTLSRIRENSNRLIVRELQGRGHKGLSTSHGNILAILIFQGERSKKELALEINKDQSTVTVLIRKLIGLGYVTTKVSKSDNRVSIVNLTEKGQLMKKDFVEISEMVFERQYKDMPVEMIQCFKEAIMVIDKNFSEG